jgi:hypothetical protein
MSDTWCRPVRARTGSVVSGGAARNVRIAARGGMDTIVADVVRDTLAKADEAVNAYRRRPPLRLVANG